MIYSQIKKRIANFSDKPYTSKRYGICNEFGLIAIVYANCVQDALDSAVDNGKLDSEIMSPEDFSEYEANGWDDSYCFAGNAGEPIWTNYLSIEELR